MPTKRTHAGIQCSIYEESPTRWTISIKYHFDGKPPSSMLIVRETTLDGAKQIADDDVKKTGHVCDSACTGWIFLGG